MNTISPVPFPPLSAVVAGNATTVSIEGMSTRRGGAGAHALDAGASQRVSLSSVPLVATARNVAASTERSSVQFGPCVPGALRAGECVRTPHNPALAMPSLRPLVHVVALPSTSGCHGLTPVAATSQEACGTAPVLLRLLRGGDTNVNAVEQMPFMAWRGAPRVPRRTPESRLTIDAISDARRYLMAMFMGNDDRLCEVEEGALMLLDTAAYRANRTDLNRRAGENFSAHGEITTRLQREIDEAERDFAHVIELHAA